MNNILDVKRFGLVFRKDLMENWKRYTLLFLTMLGFMTIVLTAQSLDHYSDIERGGPGYNLNESLLTFLSFAFAACGILFASTFMSPMNSKIKRISYLVCPSSNLEKYLSRWIIITIGYIISFFAALWIADSLRVGICSARFPNLDIKFLDLTKLVYTGNDWEKNGFLLDKDTFGIAISLYFLFQSLYLLGATFWEKASFIKTFTAGAVITLAFILLCRWAILFSYGSFEGFENVLSSFGPVNKNNINKEQVFTVIHLILSAFTLFNWTIAYFRLCESEITKRL
ncbi:MAG: hypothetical protein LBG96_17475 [Tannerella sp.]|jgi:hypothetical protein|nr:hypothetical protein [Tannerella sp.]